MTKAGEEIIVTERGKPIALLQPIQSAKNVRREDLAFGAADIRLLRAAEAEGFTSVNVETA